MSVPAKFRAFRIHDDADGYRGGIKMISLDDLNPGEVVIKTAYSSVNFKDALAGTGQGRILRRFPLVGGIDVAGHVVASTDPAFREGDAVLVTGSGLSETRDGGYAEYARLESKWVVALPGGFGTLDEMFEMLTWRQLGLGKKPCAFLDVNGFWQPLMAMLDSMVRERFLHAEQRNDLWHGDDIDILLAWMRDYLPAQADKWLDEKRRSQLKLTPEDV